MLKLCQFNLKLALVGAGALRKNIQNQTRAPQHTTLEFRLKVALLTGRQILAKHHNLGFFLFDRPGKLFQLAAADKSSRMRLRTAAADQMAGCCA